MTATRRSAATRHEEKTMNNRDSYDDIINLPHHVSARRARMSMTDRGAQFSPFAALTGFDAAIEETDRLTDRRIELTEGEKEILNDTLLGIMERIAEQPEIGVTYFVPDQRKAGGAYIRRTGRVKKIDPCGRSILMTDGTVIAMEQIIKLEELSD